MAGIARETQVRDLGLKKQNLGKDRPDAKKGPLCASRGKDTREGKSGKSPAKYKNSGKEGECPFTARRR